MDIAVQITYLLEVIVFVDIAELRAYIRNGINGNAILITLIPRQEAIKFIAHNVHNL